LIGKQAPVQFSFSKLAIELKYAVTVQKLAPYYGHRQFTFATTARQS
jgi:hypothetical protein